MHHFVFALLFVALPATAANPHPCRNLEAACKKAGFKAVHAAKDKNGLWADCLKPLWNGAAVSGVEVSADDVAACRQIREAKVK